MFISISGVGYIIVAIIAAFFSIRLMQSYKRENSPLSYFYSRTFLYLSLMSVSYSFPTFFWHDDSLKLGLGEFLGNIFLVIAFSYLMMIPIFIKRGISAARHGFDATLVLGVILLFFTVHYFPTLYFDENDILTKVYDPILKVGYYLFIAGISLIISFTFFREAFRLTGHSRVRTLLQGFAFFFGGVGGGFIKVFEDNRYLAASFISLLIGFLFIFAAALYKKHKGLTDDEVISHSDTI
jgi:hypothetical protein